MTESEWANWTKPTALLKCLDCRATTRPYALFACVCGRHTTQARYEHNGIAVRSAPLAFEVADR